jgi:hypothetical protein
VTHDDGWALHQVRHARAQPLDHDCEPGGVIGHPRLTDALDDPRRDPPLGVGVDQLVFQRR